MLRLDHLFNEKKNRLREGSCGTPTYIEIQIWHICSIMQNISRFLCNNFVNVSLERELIKRGH